jgi:hypothetical protein
MTEEEYRYAQRQLNILAILYIVANVCAFGWFIWAAWPFL